MLLQRCPQIQGRQDDFQHLLRLLDDSDAASTPVLLIDKPGSGKSTFLSHFARYMRDASISPDDSTPMRSRDRHPCWTLGAKRRFDLVVTAFVGLTDGSTDIYHVLYGICLAMHNHLKKAWFALASEESMEEVAHNFHSLQQKALRLDMSIHMSIQMSTHMSIHVSIHMSIRMSIRMSKHVPAQSVSACPERPSS